jgi:hypothetical protein
MQRAIIAGLGLAPPEAEARQANQRNGEAGAHNPKALCLHLSALGRTRGINSRTIISNRVTIWHDWFRAAFLHSFPSTRPKWLCLVCTWHFFHALKVDHRDFVTLETHKIRSSDIILMPP